MRLDGRRNSSNINDRRRISGRTDGIGGGIIGIIVIAAVTLFSGGGLGDVIGNVAGQFAGGNISLGSGSREPDAEDQRLYDLTSKVLAGSEDVWTREFRR